MSEETTKPLTVDDKLDMLLREMAVVKGDLATLTERVTDLEKRTNPLPPNYEARFTALEGVVAGIAEQQHELAKGQRRLERQMQLVQRDFFEQRTNVDDLQERVERLEHRAN